MKVKDLITQLNKLDKNLEVYTDVDSGTWFPLNNIMTYKDKVIVHYLPNIESEE